MANVSTPTTGQYSFLDQLGALLGMGDNGTSGNGMTVPTALNTSSNWTPPGAGTAATGVGAGASNGLGTGIGFNVGTGQLALSGLGSLAGIWGANQQNKLAKEQFSLQKDLANTNLNNQIKSYNTTLEDRMNSRGVAEGRSADYTADEIARRRLSR